MNRGTRRFGWRKRFIVKSDESERGCKTKPTNKQAKCKIYVKMSVEKEKVTVISRKYSIFERLSLLPSEELYH